MEPSSSAWPRSWHSHYIFWMEAFCWGGGSKAWATRGTAACPPLWTDMQVLPLMYFSWHMSNSFMPHGWEIMGYIVQYTAHESPYHCCGWLTDKQTWKGEQQPSFLSPQVSSLSLCFLQGFFFNSKNTALNLWQTTQFLWLQSILCLPSILQYAIIFHGKLMSVQTEIQLTLFGYKICNVGSLLGKTSAQAAKYWLLFQCNLEIIFFLSRKTGFSLQLTYPVMITV